MNTISLAAGNNPAFLSHKSIRAQVVVAPPNKQSNTIPVFPQLSQPGISLTDLRLQEVVKRQSRTNPFAREDQARQKPYFHPSFLEESYERCRKICEEYAKSFYLGAFPLSFLSITSIY